MYVQDGKRFRRSFCGYNRTAVDAEFNRLISQADTLVDERDSLQSQVDTLSAERNAYTSEQIRLNTTITTMTGQVMDLESSLSRAKNENETLAHEIEAHKAEKSALQMRCDQLRERDRDFAMREREFSELQSSVSSIMSVTKRATDRLFQKVVDNQERVTQIAGDAAREVAAIRADMAQVREALNTALDEVQDRIDRVDATLTGAVHKLVAIKHDDGLQVGDNQPSILSEVERLLSMRAGDVDSSDGRNYAVPVLGPYSAKFLSDTAQRVSDGRITAKPNPAAGVEIHRVMPTQFESSNDSILEANRLLERGGMTAGEYYAANPQHLPPPSSVEPDFEIPVTVIETTEPAPAPAAEPTPAPDGEPAAEPAPEIVPSVPVFAPADPPKPHSVGAAAAPTQTTSETAEEASEPEPEPVSEPAPAEEPAAEAIPMPAPTEQPKPNSVGAAAAPDPVVVRPVPVVSGGSKLVSVRARRRTN